MISTLDLLSRLLMAGLLGGLIGFEREVNNRPAGFRTHILVTLGACLIMIISLYGFIGFGPEGRGGDPARLAAQVVSGIGFLGAGTIMREGTNVRGLTTAASIWVCGGIGLAVGNGFYEAAVLTTLLAIGSLLSIRVMEKRFTKMRRYSELKVHGIGRPGFVGEIGTTLGKHFITIKNVQIDNYNDGDENEVFVGNIQLSFIIKIPAKLDRFAIYNDLNKIKGITSVKWDDVEIINNKE